MPFSKNQIRTIYLLPHAHTDIGYSHDPVVALELHDRFLDCAITLCEQTRGHAEGARFRWTVEVFFQVLHWWERRDEAARARLTECLRCGEIDIGGRYLNGTECYAPGDVEWELGEFQRLRELTGYAPDTALQNDVNGFPLAFASRLAAAGLNTIVMGLNTTMGHSPWRRCEAFRWNVGGGRELLVWNGWIYNRIKTFCHLDRMAAELPGKLDEFLGSLPADYPYDFAVTSATMGDNIGPFPSLPEQVRLFNEQNTGVRLCLATFSEFGKILAQSAVGKLPVYSGNWPDFWTFGAGAMPQMMASVRRAQRRLALVEKIRGLGWADESGGSLTMDAARRSLALACEHTYDSHSSGGSDSGSSDSLRQKAQIRVDASVAESTSMVLLRDHLTAMASTLPKNPVSVLAVNPHPWPLGLDYLTNEKGMLAFAASRRPEHLYQFDREPTFEALAASGTFGALDLHVPAGNREVVPLKDLPAPQIETLDANSVQRLELAESALVYDPGSGGLASWRTPLGEVLRADAAWSGFEPVLERPVGGFQIAGGGMEDMDPSDCAWNPELTFERSRLPGGVGTITRHALGQRHTLSVGLKGSLLSGIQFTLDALRPSRLEMTADWMLDADSTVRALYLALPFQLPGEGDCEYWIDSCGEWFRAERDQIPGTCNSFYQVASGMAVTRDGRTLYLAPADTSLFQCGGFTFSQLPSTRLQRRDPFLGLWIYNNYWGTNFPSNSPGHFRTRFAIEYREEPFRPESVAKIASAFDADHLTHPVA